MNKKIAYTIVFSDLMESAKMFRGIYDAKNGKDDFMFGIETVIEYIASQVDENAVDKFINTFTENMIKSKEKAGV